MSHAAAAVPDRSAWAFPIPMRGNEPSGRQAECFPALFPIPMRGNEQHAQEKLGAKHETFPIPMRGNEVGNIASYDATQKFPIPMRGNEEMRWGDRHTMLAVSNPHEG